MNRKLKPGPVYHMADDAQCPGCNESISAASPLGGDQRPGPGDLTVCGHCGALLQYLDCEGHCEHLAASTFKALDVETRKDLATAQARILSIIRQQQEENKRLGKRGA